MASATEKPPANVPSAEVPRAEERFVDEQIRSTRRALKLVDLATGIITLVIGVLVFLLAAVMLEQWIVPGGWSSTAREVLFVALVSGASWYSWRMFWPLVRRPINPAYAAQTIENSSPSLKNSLLNWLLLRNRQRQLPQQVYQAIEKQAAQRLSEVSLESVVDRSAILRLGYVLVAIVAVCALYRVLSPKDPLASAGRVLLPWADIPVPSRVRILDLEPGKTAVARGEQLDVSAEILGLDEQEPVRLRYSTADQQIVGQEILMTASSGGSRYEGRLPAAISPGDSGGIQQDLTYWLEAGDARSPRYQVTVFARPTLIVQRVRYDYPDYTGYPTAEVAHTGDLRAIEGTQVTIFAVANQPIGAAHVDFDADGRRDLLMRVDAKNGANKQATVSFPLELRDDRRTPRYGSYVLRYTTTEGRKNRLPPKYQIDVTPDYDPEIRLLAPPQALLEVHLNQQASIEIEARDPDFALSQVTLVGETAGRQILKQVLLSENQTGRFVGQARLTPADLGLRAGDVLEYWAVAADNRRPEPNLAFTEHRKIRVVGPAEGDGKQPPNRSPEAKNEAKNGDQPSGQDEPQQGDNPQDGPGMAGGDGEPSDAATTENGEGGVGQPGDSSPDDGQQKTGQGAGGESSAGKDNADTDGDESGTTAAQQNDDATSPEQNNPAPSDAAGDKNRGDQSQVSPEGDDDGTAFERIAKHFGQQDGPGEAKSDRRAADGAPDADQTGDGTTSDGAEPKRSANANDAAGARPDRNAPDAGAEGENSKPHENSADTQQDTQPDSKAPGGEMQSDQGPAGAGQNPGENQGAPTPDGAKKPHDKQGQGPTDRQQTNDQEPGASSKGQTESDSQGAQGGDRAGGGQEGGGQQADAEGTGGAGQHQAAEDGGGQAAQPGEGESSSRPGDRQQTDRKTGQSSQDQPGGGSQAGSQAGNQPGGDGQGMAQGDQQQTSSSETEATAGNQASANDSQQPSTNQDAGNQPNSSGAAGQEPLNGGSGNGQSSPPPAAETQPGDQANLDYARRQTDLILDRLDDELRKHQVDPQLLKKLGWSEDELRRFVARWKNLEAQAVGNSAEADSARQELDNKLRSLGLGRNRRSGFQAKVAKDKLRDLQEAYHGRTPLEYVQQVRAYVKGTAAAKND